MSDHRHCNCCGQVVATGARWQWVRAERELCFWTRWMGTYRYFNMLSNPRSHERNVEGNTVSALLGRPIALMGKRNDELRAEIVALRKELFDRKAEAKYKAELATAVGCLSDLGSKQQRAVNAKLREENKKFRAYVREHGPCEKCYYGDKGCDRHCDSGDAWAAIREV